jgi:hypothetical protein
MDLDTKPWQPSWRSKLPIALSTWANAFCSNLKFHDSSLAR